MQPVISAKDISKSYQIGGLDGGYATFREFLAEGMLRPIRRLRGDQGMRKQTIWALQEINFEIEQGETVGLIGDNGAGKSTLLKILSRITIPTTGRTEVRGRMGSLLEVGTGFHPDLTGRENIYLNGTILGIRRSEIRRRFDEIVAFSEIEKFIDTPVKWYSSGMYLRLAFSVAVHLDADVLFMDEVLAVGDVNFQQKCFDKIHEIRNEGRTIIFVSHNMPAVTRLCRRVILLDKGHMIADGPAHKVVNDYLGASWKVTSEREWPDTNEAPGNDMVRLRRVRVRDEEGRTIESSDIRHAVGVEIIYQVLEPGLTLTPKIDLFNDAGAHLFSTHDVGYEWRYRPRPPGEYVSTAWIPGNFLSEGNLLVNVALMSHSPTTALYAQAGNAVTFQIVDNQAKDSARGDYVGPIGGVLRPLLDWTTEFHVADKPIEPVTEALVGQA
jgi:lipopolysaccharide transport system ATP-binding protein